MELLELTFPKFMKNKRWLREKQNATFGDWLKERVANAMSVPDNDVSETMRWMAGGPRHEVPTFSGYHVSGVDFNTKSRDNVRSVQNSGVFLLADAMQVASAKDRKPRTDDMDFYGVIKTIWEIMAPSNRAAAAKAIALRMKAVQMKRTSSKDAGPSTTPKALSPKKRVVSAKKKEVSPKKKVVQTKKKTRSPKKKTKAVSKKSVSKTKSGNSSKSNKIEDGDDEEDPDATGGLKLLRRGMVTMNRITRRLIRGRKLTIQINDKGEPYGKAAKEMQSYIGVLARTKISIVTGDWREVDPEEKQKIWESIVDAYVIPKECKKLVITSAANKWREFKSKLTNKYIIPYMDTPELLENPPDNYRCVKKADWDIFVADRISEKFQELRDAQIEKRKENRYPHRMARKGYANLEAELSESIPLEKLDRATMWVKARQDKNGCFKEPEVEKTAERIERLKKKESDGELTTDGSDDVLTLALGKPEHPGRVRGVGGFTKPASYFNLPKSRKKSVEETVRKSVKLILEEEKESILAKERVAWEQERDRQVAEERAYWTAKIARLEAKIDGKEVPLESPESPKQLTPLHEHGSGQGSCSRPAEKILIDIVEGDGKTVKKKLVLAEEKIFVQEDEQVATDQPKQKLTSIIEEEVRVHISSKNSDNELVDGNDCGLAIDRVENIVAYGTVIQVNVEEGNQKIHGVPLGEDNVRVSVIGTIVHDALLPFPVKDADIVTVGDAIGTCVAWPRKLVVIPAPVAPPKPIEQKKTKRANPKKRIRDSFDDDNEDLENLPTNLPLPVKDLCMWAKTELMDGATIHTTFGGEIFGHSRKAVIFRRDIYNMANMLEVSGGVIVFYMSYIYGVLKKSKMLDMVGFIDPAHTGIIGCGNPTERARSMSNRYMLGKPGQIFLVPYNSGAHWMLSVVNPDEEVVHFMDPLKRRLCAGEWKSIVDNSIKIFNAQKARKGRKIIQWKNLAGIPEQTDSKTCGYFVMRYMKEIVEDKNLEYATKWERKSNLAYTQKDIDVVRAEWANHVMKF